ncbi:uncharacterized protein LOC125586052 [Brassica napus]|uniref:uncharacterized protein LOC125586052 n=1 Tax=Brassica napus TaxID=3708 RepID=UPI00207A31AA|nr:uncharacterized protein LOC125586052 [Brassica napus]
MKDFFNCTVTTGLADLPYCGNSFTWSNNQGTSVISKKLDRTLVNDEWLHQFPNSLGVFGDPGISDHSPCCVYLDTTVPRKKLPFKFFTMLNDNLEFGIIISECWNSLNFEGTMMFKVSRKLKELKSIIRSFSKENYSGIEKRVLEAFESLTECQRTLLSSLTPQAGIDERLAFEKWYVLAKAEESFFFQKYRVTWIDKGDSNTTFYHRQLRTRTSQNQIIFLNDDQGNILSTREDIMSHVVAYYETLLGGTPSITPSTTADLSSLLQFRCSENIVTSLQAPVTALNIQGTFFSLPKNKAPGPDGYPAEFFTAHWKTVGDDMIKAVQEFFDSGRLLQQWNSTIITLIPKKQNATEESAPFGDLQHTVSVYPRKLLVENVLMATELVNGYNWKNITKRSLLKVDLKKAFDSLNWSFILLVLRVLGFPESFVSLISECITTTRFSVAVNGELGGYFKGARGLRQGDPLSPYLFVLAMEVFAQMLNRNFDEATIGYHPQASDPSVTHPAFADDIMVFLDGQYGSLQQITWTLDSFSTWSGLTMNRDKTELFVAGMSQTEVTDMTSLGFSLGSLPVRYLGLPLMHRKLRICDYRPLLDQLKRRCSSWSSRALSYAGRKLLLSTIIFGTLNFWFSSFILPKGCIKAIESICSRFLWNGNITNRAAAKLSWKTVCLPRSEGGLGLRDLHTWNKTLSLKLVWLLHSESESLWAKWTKTHRLKGASLWSMDEKKQCSWIWTSILKLRSMAEQFLRCEIGNGSLAFFWFDYWQSLGPLIDFFGSDGPANIGVPLSARVKECCTSTGWSLRPAGSPIEEQLQTLLCSITLPSSTDRHDVFKWYVNDKYLDSFSTSKTWEVVRPRGTRVDWESVVWFSGHIPKHAFNMWVANYDRLPTRCRLAAWDTSIVKTCLLCGHCDESRDHLFLRCSFSKQIWKEITICLGYRPFYFHTWTALIAWLDAGNTTSPLILRRLAAQATIYNIWIERNNRLHKGLTSTPPRLCKDIDRLLRNIILARKNRSKFNGLMQVWLMHAV